MTTCINCQRMFKRARTSTWDCPYCGFNSSIKSHIHRPHAARFAQAHDSGLWVAMSDDGQKRRRRHGAGRACGSHETRCVPYTARAWP